jgi:hypothetical protein
MSSEEYPVAEYGDDKFPQAFDLPATIENMVPTEIVYMPVSPPDPTNRPLLLNQHGRLFLSRYAEYERTEYVNPHDPHEGPAPDWSQPFVGIMGVQKIRSDGKVIEGYIVDIRAVPSELVATVDFSEIPEHIAEALNASAIKVFGVIRPDIDGEMNYDSPDNAETEDAARYLWSHTNSTRPDIAVEIVAEPTPTTKTKKKNQKKIHDDDAPQTVLESGETEE